MRLLALDASGAECSAALLEDGAVLDRAGGGDSRGAARTLPGLVMAILARHGQQLDGIGVTVGPGSFTGLRAAIALAQGIALGTGAPLAGVTVAEALLAERASTARPIWVALDGRRAGRVFLVRDGHATAEALDALPCPDGAVVAIGDAADAVADRLRRAGHGAQAEPPRAVDIVAVGRAAARRLARALPLLAVLPLYVEPPEARPITASRPSAS